MTNPRQGESGNVIYYIFAAIVLLAALSFAVARGGRSSMQTLGNDRDRLLASEIVNYSHVVKTAVTQLRLRGVPFGSLSFAATGLDVAYGTPGANPPNEIFNAAGGGGIYQSPNPDALDGAAAEFVFTGGNEVDQVGTTCGADACADLIVVLPHVKKDVCVKINNLLSIGAEDADPPTDTRIDLTPFAGTAAYVQTVGDEDSSLKMKTAACANFTGNGFYAFYEVLQAR
jgi:hypothetical protein